jgi:4-hydroxybenzoate polyprenyltransferase
MKSIVRLIRLPNLLIVVLVQWILQYRLLVPFYQGLDLQPMLGQLDFGILMLVTVLISASGYITNDIYDYPIDLVNKPEKMVIGKSISLQSARFIFYALVILGGCLSLYLALKIDRVSWFLIYPIAVGLLMAYAKYFKKTTLVGNMIVAAYCAGVAGIVFFPEWEMFWQETMTMDALRVISILAGFCFFAFFSTMYREIVKDIEDMEGDRQYGCRTLPIVAGESFAKRFALVWLFVLLLILTMALPLLWKWSMLLFIWMLVAVLGPGIASGYFLIKADSKPKYHLASQVIKLFMLTGTLTLLILNF